MTKDNLQKTNDLEEKKNRKKFRPITVISIAVILVIIYLLDIFVFVPENVNIMSSAHLIDGDKRGYLTQNLKLITSKVLDGQLWRVFTAMFLHAGIAHISINLIALIGIGWFVEKQLGHIKTLVAFLTSGVISAFLMMLITHIEDGLGASTAIFGLMGVSIILMLKYKEVFIKKCAGIIV